MSEEWVCKLRKNVLETESDFVEFRGAKKVFASREDAITGGRLALKGLKLGLGKGDKEVDSGVLEVFGKESLLLTASELAESKVFRVCRLVEPKLRIIGKEITEEVEQSFYEQCGEVAEGNVIEASKEEVEDLGKRLTKVMQEWLTNHNYGSKCLRVVNLDVVFVNEDENELKLGSGKEMEEINYTVCGWNEEGSIVPDVEETTTSYRVADNKARSLGETLPRVEVQWHRKSDGQKGYYNKLVGPNNKQEGHSLTAENWSTLKESN